MDPNEVAKPVLELYSGNAVMQFSVRCAAIIKDDSGRAFEPAMLNIFLTLEDGVSEDAEFSAQVIGTRLSPKPSLKHTIRTYTASSIDLAPLWVQEAVAALKERIVPHAAA